MRPVSVKVWWCLALTMWGITSVLNLVFGTVAWLESQPGWVMFHLVLAVATAVGVRVLVRWRP